MSLGIVPATAVTICELAYEKPDISQVFTHTQLIISGACVHAFFSHCLWMPWWNKFPY